MRPWVLGFVLVSTLSALRAAPQMGPSPTPGQGEAESTPVDSAVGKARSEVKSARDMWDKARLEATVYEKRHRRAYERWVKAMQTDKAVAAVKRDRAMEEFKLSLERRRLAWYRWEDARAQAKAVEAASERRKLRGDMERVRVRIRTMEKALGLKPSPTPSPIP